MAGPSLNPRFFSEPFRYLRWASIHKPAYFYSVIIGATGPALLVVVPPIRRYIGDEAIPRIPMTYPVPSGPRPRPTGFDDE